MSRIAVIGASGLVGSTLTERLLAQGSDEVVPFIHSGGNAMRLARRGVELKMLDLMDRGEVEAALAGVTHVVNCSRGDDGVMLSGLTHLLAASRRHRIARFVHLSSVAVYGDPPPPESVAEDAPTSPARGTYGWIKLQQDRLVAKATAEGVPSVVLCPPNISGPYSYYLVALVDALRAGTFALLDDGASPCNLIDVENLCHAIELALREGPADGARLFVTDDADTSWGNVVESMLPLAQPDGAVPRVGRPELVGDTAAGGRRSISLTGSLKHLVSSDVREAMRKDPLWEKVDVALRRGVAHLGRSVESRLRLSVEGPIRVAKAAPRQRWDTGLCRQQLRGVRHSCELAKQRLGYTPLYTVAQSMRAFQNWYRASHGMDTSVWPLLRQL
jgi:nucleoside-diphosphate-sugar epimerase